MDFGINFEEGIFNTGNLCRLKKLMKKAENGGAFTIGFIGGSITQGSLSSKPETCYAYLVYKWWKRMFPKADFKYVNAGIGATSSQFGAARAKSDLLKYSPDFVVAEFSVNDENNDFFMETYDGLIRRIYSSASKPAVLIFNNMRYDNGVSAQERHIKIGKHYGIPCIGIKPVIDKIRDGKIRIRDITPDGLHPNDEGHRLLAESISHFLEKVYSSRNTDESEPPYPAPLTADMYENASRLQNYNYSPAADGFKADNVKQDNITQVFRNGWTACKKGASVTFEAEGTELAVQYRKSVKKPAPVALAVVDGCAEHAVRLDANFDEDWGDCLYMSTLLRHGELKKHTVKITLTDVDENNAVPFYLASLIFS